MHEFPRAVETLVKFDVQSSQFVVVVGNFTHGDFMRYLLAKAFQVFAAF